MAYFKLAEVILTAQTNTITISNINPNLKVLHLISSLRTTEAVVGSTALLRYNNDAGANYSSLTATVTKGDATAPIPAINESATSAGTLAICGNSGLASTFSIFNIHIFNYAGSGYKNTIIEGGHEQNTATGGGGTSGGSTWKSTSPITTITFTAGSGNFVVGSSVFLYAYN